MYVLPKFYDRLFDRNKSIESVWLSEGITEWVSKYVSKLVNEQVREWVSE